MISSAAGGAYWPIAIRCPSLGPFPSIGGGGGLVVLRVMVECLSDCSQINGHPGPGHAPTPSVTATQEVHPWGSELCRPWGVHTDTSRGYPDNCAVPDVHLRGQ